ncbi:hypothetical protein HRbin20_00087 [bacterium HR20]|nr:hypothetical protein HRbin20_00087 [bacterium HR20]
MERVLTSNRAALVEHVVTAVQRALGQRRIRLVALAGESGYGKTTLLECCRARLATAARTALVECPAPIGQQSVPLVQPLYPFLKGIELLLANPQEKAKRRLIMNIGLSVLGMIPLVGSIFDVTKEVLRDMREYRREAGQQPATQTEQIAYALEELAAESPLVLLFDDAQWLDAASVELLEQLLQTNRSVPLAIVFAYEPSVTQAQNPALEGFLAAASSGKIVQVEVPLLSRSELCQLAQQHLEHYRPDTVFDEWLLQQTGGVPAVAIAYLQYFRQHSPFKADGSLDLSVLRTDYRPASLYAMLEETLGGLDEETKLVLALCAAEGMTFTVFVVAQLLQRDPIGTVRLLRSLQQRSGVIRSLGMRRLYGVETTAYTFTHAGYYRYFVEYLEHEERIEVHSRIAAILQERMRSAADDALAEQLAPIVAAHLVEAGNTAAAEQVLEQLYRTALETGHTLVAAFAQRSIGENEHTDSLRSAESRKDFFEELGAVVALWYAGNLEDARRAAEQLVLDGRSPLERLLGELVRIRIALDLGETQHARTQLAALAAEEGAAFGQVPELASLVAAMRTVADCVDGRIAHAWEHAVESALHARQASVHVQCVALANIALILGRVGHPQQRIALQAAERLSAALSFSAIAAELRLQQ